MTKQYTKRDEDFKKMIVNLCETSSGKTMSDIARKYGVSRTNITNWEKIYGTITTSTGEVTNNDEILKLQKKNLKLEQEVEILKKAVAIFSKKIEDKIKFIDDYKHLYDIRALCKCLNVHHSVYYYHCNHKENSYQLANQKLDIEIERIYKESKKRYGSPKITKVLESEGIKKMSKKSCKKNENSKI